MAPRTSVRMLLRWNVLIFLVTLFPLLITSKAIRGVLNLNLNSPSGHSPGPPPHDPEASESSQSQFLLPSSSSSSSSSSYGSSTNISSSTACNLVPLTFNDEDPSSNGVQLRSYDDKFLIHVTHPAFQVSNGVVPTIIYQVTVEVPSGHEFSLEYWVNGLTEEWKGLKRRHQRDRREVLELYPAPASADQVVFCSKNSIAGLNPDPTAKILTFNWFLNIHPAPPVPWSSTGNTPSLPTTVIFRLRFRSIVETTSSVFEQNLSVSVRPTCQLVANINERIKLTLSYLWNSGVENKGLNCTVLIRPKKDFGFQLHWTNLSVYGIRDSCKQRYLSLAVPSTLSKDYEGSGESSFDLKAEEFSGRDGGGGRKLPTSSLFGGEKKFCGKIEDYLLEERTLTFPAKSPNFSNGESSSSSPASNQVDGDDKSEVPENFQSALKNSVLLSVILPTALKPKEQFALELIPLSPCQKVQLTQLSGELKYGKRTESDECSIAIHVPYGNTILTKLTFDQAARRVVNESEWDVSADHGESESRKSKNKNYNMSNSIPPVLPDENGSHNGDDIDVDDDGSECKLGLEDSANLFLVTAVDMTSGMSYKWCVDATQRNYYHRAWRSLGNHIVISFSLNYFHRFHLTYQSFNIPEITGQCDTGWVTLDYGCVTLIQTPQSWHSAEEDCKSRGGHLATVRDELAEQKIEKIITESALYHPSRAYWIGANDRDSEGSFQWTSGLPFMYSNWFPGWMQKGNDVVNAQPNDDGFSGQDCVELRQRFSSYSTQHGKSLEINSISVRGSFVPVASNEKFYWNDRNCEIKNLFLCEKGTQQKQDFSCNQSLRLPQSGMEFITVTSPAYPSSYPDNIICVTTVETLPGYRLIVQFDEFFLEESPSCKYDSLEIFESWPGGEIRRRGENRSAVGGRRAEDAATGGEKVGEKVEEDLEKVSGEKRDGIRLRAGEEDHLEFPLYRDKDKLLERICGNWNKRLKLLRYTTSPGTGQIHFKFESDFSHHFQGFKARVTAEIVKGWLSEKEKTEQCVDQHMQRFGSNCYLFVSFPPVNWNTAHQTCLSIKGNLVSVLSFEEWNFLTRNLISGRNKNNFDRKATYWLGGFIDQSSQLVWMDRMQFNFSAFHPSDLQTISNWKCLSLYWHEGGKGEFAWRLSECKQLSGYICKKHTQVEVKHGFNRTLSGTGGKLSSPNFPANYYNNLDYTNHLVAPNGTQIVVRFSHLDVESQEDCLYDYVEIIDRRARNVTRFCGSHLQEDLSKLDYVSSSNEVDVVFHSDYADTLTGFEIIWRAVDVSGCTSGRTILTGIANGFPLHDASIFTPNFPHFNLPGLDCSYTIVAPAGQRIWLSFQIFEIGKSPADSQQGISASEDYCSGEDRVLIGLGSKEDGGDERKNEMVLCGNLTSVPHRATFVSYRERLTVRVFSPKGKTGRGFLGKFKAIPGKLNENLAVITQPNTTFPLTSINYPLAPSDAVNFTVSFTAPPNYVLTIRVRGKSYPKCHFTVSSYVEIRDPYAKKGTIPYIICQPDETESRSLEELIGGSSGSSSLSENDGRKIGMHSLTGVDSTFTFRSSFNRLDARQVYAAGSNGRRWTAQIGVSWDLLFRDKVLGSDDSLLNVKSCNPNPCLNEGRCSTEQGRNICRCVPPYTGPFCGLSFCDLSPCLFGKCVLTDDKAYRCECQLGYGGENCDRRKKPCDERPCTGHGDCIEIANSSYKCNCHAYWEGPRCEARMSHIPYRPLSQRMLKEPFWLGMITVTVVLGVIGLVWCLKRHFPEKLDKLLNDDLDRNRGISWVSGRSPSSIRIGGGSGVALKDPVPGPSQQSSSPPTSRSFLGRFGIRKPSLLSLSSATSAVSVTASSPHQYENRTFSLDDLLRPTRSMMRTPSPHRRRNYSIQVRRDPAEKQQILQQLVSSGGSQSLDGDKPSTPKPTIAEIIQMSEKRLRLASASSVTSDTMGDKKQSSLEGEAETSFSNVPPAIMLTPTSKAEKKVTFARLLDKLAATEMSSSSSCSDISCAEEKTIPVPPKPPERKKDRKGRFRRSKSYNRGRSSETDQDVVEMSSSDTTPDPICPPRFPTRLCISPTGSSSPSHPTGLSAGGKLQTSKSLTKMASADSLLALFRRFSGSSSAPPSPQYSENEDNSIADGHGDMGATPLSTPSSPRNTNNVRPPGLIITNVEQNSTIELPVIDPFGQQNNWRSGQSSSITLEVPLRDYCLSPIHEVPTPLPTPSHSPAHTPLMHRQNQATESVPAIKVLISSEDEGNSNGRRSAASEPNHYRHHAPKLSVPVISVSLDGEDEELEVNTPLTAIEKSVHDYNKTLTGEAEVIPDVLIHIPPEVSLESKPDSCCGEGSRQEDCSRHEEPTAFVFPPPVRPPRLSREKHKPPPLIFANEILSSSECKDDLDPRLGPKTQMMVPTLSIECATPVQDLNPKFDEPIESSSPFVYYNQVTSKPWDIHVHPLAPPVITINQSSEAESDSDTPVVRKLLRRPNLTFLSPFVGSSDRVPSESNLSTSGYSSMASPCPSRCPSVSPLCPSEAEDNYHGSSHQTGSSGPYGRRSSLTPATTRKSSLTHRRCSLNTASPLISSSSFSRDDNIAFNEEFEKEDKTSSQDILAGRNTQQGFETDSAVEVELETDNDNQPSTPVDLTPVVAIEDMKIDFLQVPRKSMPKSRSLDMNVTGGDRKNQLKGDSLDSKLNSVDPSSETFSKFMEMNVCNKTGSILEMPEDSLSDKIRLSPVSSRSDSPISELSVVCLGGVSPLTDSDGLYDCPSSEVPNGGGTTLSKQQPLRRSGRKRERKSSVSTGQKKSEGGVGRKSDLAGNWSKDDKDPSGHSQTTTRSGSPAAMADEDKGKVVPSMSTTSSDGVKSPRRRIRVSSFVPSTSSSSSSESLNSPSRGYGSSGSNVPTGKVRSSSTSAFPLLLDASGPRQRTPSPTHSGVQWPTDSEPQLTGGQVTAIGDDQKVTTTTTAREKGSNKFSRLRAISNQIRFLRRLELSLLRKKESLGVVTGQIERHDSLLSIMDSGESRCDTSSETQSSISESYLTLADVEQPLISLKSIVATRNRKKRRRCRASILPSPTGSSSVMMMTTTEKTDSADTPAPGGNEPPV